MAVARCRAAPLSFYTDSGYLEGHFDEVYHLLVTAKFDRVATDIRQRWPLADYELQLALAAGSYGITRRVCLVEVAPPVAIADGDVRLIVRGANIVVRSVAASSLQVAVLRVAEVAELSGDAELSMGVSLHWVGKWQILQGVQEAAADSYEQPH